MKNSVNYNIQINHFYKKKKSMRILKLKLFVIYLNQTEIIGQHLSKILNKMLSLTEYVWMQNIFLQYFILNKTEL